MTLPWLRLYTRITTDNKIRLLAFEDRWHFVALLCLKRTGLLDEPESELKHRRIAVEMGLQVRELEEVFRRLSEVGLTDKQGNPLKFADLQFESDSSTERVRKYREKKKKKGSNASETLQQPRGNGEVTGQDTDTDTDTPLPDEAPRSTSGTGGGPW